MKNTLNLILAGIIILNVSVPFAKPKGDYPPSIVELTIESHGQKMSGLAYLAQGKGPHPTVLLLHGYPGNEKNLDIAQALRVEGWNVVFFHYRGSWGSEGEFSFLQSELDVQAVMQYMMDENNAKKLRINKNQMSTVGHSMGGHMAIAGILDNPNVRCAVAIDGANLGALPEDSSWHEEEISYGNGLFMLSGWSGEKSLNELMKHKEELNLIHRANKIAGRPVMFIPANSVVIPVEEIIKPLVDAFKKTENSKVFYQLIEDDHSFSSSRKELTEAIKTFLNENCK